MALKTPRVTESLNYRVRLHGAAQVPIRRANQKLEIYMDGNGVFQALGPIGSKPASRGLPVDAA